METIAAPLRKAQLAKEIAALPPSTKLLSRGSFDVYLVQAASSPELMHEIGRQREITFRSVGEGSGKTVDIDAYDTYYFNLFLWQREDEEIAGGYRLGPGAEIFEAHGVGGFYLNSLFEIKAGFNPYLKKSVELGRSFITEKHQKNYLPFFLLWSGILVYLLHNPGYQYLIGPVSISKYYSEVSKSIIVSFVKKFFFDEELAKFFTPRQPYYPCIEDIDFDRLVTDKIRDLESFLSEIEPNHIKVPMLIRQYTKMKACFVSFNLDPDFSDVLDGLMVLDIQNIPPEIIQLLKEK
jgi:hypothetical protein